MKFLIIALIVLVAIGAYIRFAPANQAKWHIDPATAPAPDAAGYRVAFYTSETPDKILKNIDKIALSTRGVNKLFATTSPRKTTYVARSLFFGFPDYITVQADKATIGGRVTILSRLRFGVYDLGVNATRVNAWIEALQAQGIDIDIQG